jgi:hypothetical protein
VCFWQEKTATACTFIYFLSFFLALSEIKRRRRPQKALSLKHRPLFILSVSVGRSDASRWRNKLINGNFGRMVRGKFNEACTLNPIADSMYLSISKSPCAYVYTVENLFFMIEG